MREGGKRRQGKREERGRRGKRGEEWRRREREGEGEADVAGRSWGRGLSSPRQLDVHACQLDHVRVLHIVLLHYPRLHLRFRPLTLCHAPTC